MLLLQCIMNSRLIMSASFMSMVGYLKSSSQDTLIIRCWTRGIQYHPQFLGLILSWPTGSRKPRNKRAHRIAQQLQTYGSICGLIRETTSELSTTTAATTTRITVDFRFNSNTMTQTSSETNIGPATCLATFQHSSCMCPKRIC